MEISGKVVFITGAARGLGKAYAEAVLELGAKVFLGDVNSDAGTATLKEFTIRFSEDNVRFLAFDVTDYQQFKDAFNLAVSTFGHVDVMVNNAGILDESRVERTININYTSVVFGTNLAVEHMRKDKGGRGGRIINISSITGLGDYFFLPVYCGTKHAVRAFTSSLAQPNIEEQGIEFGILCPDAVNTTLIWDIEGRVPFVDDAKSRLQTTPLPIPTVVDAFLELLQLEKLNGAILQISTDGKTYRKMKDHIV